jgi:LCP family protein required for cell wall assembly
MNPKATHNPRQPGRASLLGWGILFIVLILAGVVAVFTFRAVRDFVSAWEITDLPGFVVKGGDQPTAQTQASPGEPTAAVPQPAPDVLTPPPWDGSSRVSILVMGLDFRDWQAGEGPPRTDTMILLTIDPVARSAAMLSIPRDLWVVIPGFDHNKINTAYQLGEAYKIPGGGPELARQTVESLLGVPIQYYAQVDFSAFVRFIDEINGVEIDVPEAIKVDLLGDGKETIKNIKPGRQVLPGELALAYVRARYTEGGDFDRARRQQLVIFGIRERLLDPQMLPVLLSKAPALYQEISAGVNTNLGFEQAIQLGLLALDIPLDKIQRGVIGSEQVTFGKSPEGLDVLKPRPEQIRLLRDELFASNGAINPGTPEADPLARARLETARIAILNGAGVPGLASRTSEYLRSQGLDAPDDALADGNPSFYTTIIDYTGNPYTLGYLVELMGVSANNLRIRYEPGSAVDVEIVLGNDWANSNPMP